MSLELDSPAAPVTLSPRALRRRALAGILVAFPAAYFVSASLLKYGLGVEGPYAPFEMLTATPQHQRLFNLLSPFVFVGGLVAACVLNALPLVNVRTRWSRGDLVGQLRVYVRPANMIVAAVAGGTLAILLGYLLMENLHHLGRGIP